MIDGVVRSPSEFSITLTLPPSITATQELVVPKSIPIILLIESLQIFLNTGAGGSLRTVLVKSYIGALSYFSSLLINFWCILGLGHHHHGRAHNPTIQQIAFLHNGNH